MRRFGWGSGGQNFASLVTGLEGFLEAWDVNQGVAVDGSNNVTSHTGLNGTVASRTADTRMILADHSDGLKEITLNGLYASNALTQNAYIGLSLTAAFTIALVVRNPSSHLMEIDDSTASGSLILYENGAPNVNALLTNDAAATADRGATGGTNGNWEVYRMVRDGSGNITMVGTGGGAAATAAPASPISADRLRLWGSQGAIGPSGGARFIVFCQADLVANGSWSQLNSALVSRYAASGIS